MSNTIEGSINSSQSSKFDYALVENLLNLQPETLLEVYWDVEVSTYGEYAPATFNDPAEFEEIDCVETKKVFFEVLLDSKMVSVEANQEQIDILEKYRPDNEDLFWDIVNSN